jgi:hypothetical protein
MADAVETCCKKEKGGSLPFSQKTGRLKDWLIYYINAFVLLFLRLLHPSSIVQGATNVSTANVIGKVLAEILTSA